MHDSNTPIIQIYYAEIADITRYQLTEADTARLDKIRSKVKKIEFASSHTVLNSILLDTLQITLDQLQFSYNACGKPFLSPELQQTGNLYFSLSHSGSGIAVALCQSTEIGIDIEDNTSRSYHSCQKLAERFFSQDEQKVLTLTAEKPDEYLEQFFRIWTLKEACLKAAGTGINTILSKLSFSLLPENKAIITSHAEFTRNFSFYSAQYNGYSLAVAAGCSAQPVIRLLPYCQYSFPSTENTIDFSANS